MLRATCYKSTLASHTPVGMSCYSILYGSHPCEKSFARNLACVKFTHCHHNQDTQATPNLLA